MIKNFWLMALLLVLMMAGVAVHYLTFDRDGVRDGLVSVGRLSGITSPAFSVACYEPRTPSDQRGNISYPEMPPIERMDFVYAEK